MEHQTIFNLCWDSAESLFLTLSKNFLIVNVNRATEEVFDCSKNELLNKNINVIFEKKLGQVFKKKIHSHEKTQIMTPFFHGAEKSIIMWEVIPLPENILEETPAFLMIGKIDNRLTEKQQETLRFENLIKYAPGLFYWKNKERVYQGCNDEFAKLSGLISRFDVEGKTDYDLPWKDRAALYTTIDKAVLMTGKPDLNREETVTITDGQAVTMITNKVPLFNKSNQVVGVLGITVDITHQKKIEESLKIAIQKLETANKAKTEFLENMRHDIRTPLTGITGFADMIKNEATDPKIKEYADNLVASSYSLLDLLNGVLEAIKVSSGEVPRLKKKFSLKNKLNEIILLNQSKAHQKKLALLFEHDPAIPNYLMGDSTRIHRVILELVTNALNFTHKGQVKLSTQLVKKYKDDVIVKIIVADTGIGIQPEQQQDIYVRFKRLTPSYEGIYKGAGLGLSIAKQFMDDLQGELYVESQIDRGSTFTCVLKLKKPLLNEALGSEDIIPLKNTHQFIPVKKIKSLENIVSNITEFVASRILVVEDSEIAAKIVTCMLSTMNCQVDVANRGVSFKVCK